jgi:hypothetical protein
MNSYDIDKLIEIGATDRVRKYLKKLAIDQRMKALNKCIPLIKVSKGNLKFFRENFSSEIGAILISEGDLSRAEELYRSSKKVKR